MDRRTVKHQRCANCGRTIRFMRWPDEAKPGFWEHVGTSDEYCDSGCACPMCAIGSTECIGDRTPKARPA